jgi:hypothetical protein
MAPGPASSTRGRTVWATTSGTDTTGAITHGSQVSTSNTGYAAYLDPGLGRTLVAGDLTRVAGTHWISDFTSGGTGGTAGNPKIVEKLDIDEVLWDVDHVTLRASNVREHASGFLNGTHHVGILLDYVTISPTPGVFDTEPMHYESWSANRCQLRGCSDGGKINGGADTQNIVECYIRVAMESPDDHNDGLQNVGGSGTVNVSRCNISVVPELIETGGIGGPNACIMSADMTSGSVYHLEVTDCLLNGGTAVSTIRFYDGALTTNITYVGTGNRFIRSSAAPVDRGSANTTPTNQITWSNNVWDDDSSSIPLA